MHAKGHAGMALLITFSFLSFFKLTSFEYIITALLTVAASTLPDIDLQLEIKHRKYTHNILAAIIIGALIGIIYSPLGFYVGFIAGFSAVWIHILGDLLTYMEFAPLWPFIKKKVSLKLFKSGNPTANNAFWSLGVTAFLVYFLFIYSNAGYFLIKAVKEIIKTLIT